MTPAASGTRVMLSATASRSQREPAARRHAVVPAYQGRSRRAAAGRAAAFNKNDPATWYGSSTQADEYMDAEEGFSAEPQTLSTAELAALLDGSSVPQLVQPGPVLPGGEAAPPTSAGEAIAQGLALYKAKEMAPALEQFEQALALPGSGVRKQKNGPRELSTGERQAALYNIACCQAALGNEQDGLAALVACLEAGFDDFRGLRSDGDLAVLRASAKFEAILGRFEPKGLLALLMGNKKR